MAAAVSNDRFLIEWLLKGPRATKKDAEPSVPTEPRRRGVENSTWPAPPAGRGTSTASLLQEPCGSGSSFSVKQFSLLTQRSSCRLVALQGSQPVVVIC